MRTFRWKVKPGMNVTLIPSVREARFDSGHLQCAPTGLNAGLRAYDVTLSVSCEGVTALESFLAEHGSWKAFLWTPSYGYKQVKVICAERSSQASMLCVGPSAEFKQVVN